MTQAQGPKHGGPPAERRELCLCTPLCPQGLVPQVQQTTGVQGTGVRMPVITHQKCHGSQHPSQAGIRMPGEYLERAVGGERWVVGG